MAKDPVYHNLIQDVQIVEEHGEIVSGRRIAFIKLFDSAIEDDLGDPDVQTAVFSALDSKTMPQPGDSWSSKIPRLCVVKRTPQLLAWNAEERIAKLKVTLEYELEAPDKGYPLRGGCNAAQIMTGKDRNGLPVEYTYGSTTYRTEVSVFGAEETEVRETVEDTDHPGTVRAQWRNRINSDLWMGDAAGHWLITRIEYRLLNAQTKPNRYVFTWEFQKCANPDGWQPQVIYRKDDGTIPVDATWTGVDWYEPKAFSEKFPWQGEVKA